MKRTPVALPPAKWKAAMQELESLIGKPNPELERITTAQKIMVAIIAAGTAVLIAGLLYLLAILK